MIYLLNALKNIEVDMLEADMKKQGQKKHRLFSRVIALVVIQAVVLSGIQGAYCGESLRQKSDHLSPQINIGAAELQNAFNITSVILTKSAKTDARMSRRKFLSLSAVVATALVVAPSFTAKSIAGTLTKEERKKFEEIRNRIRASEAAKEVKASYYPTKMDQEKDVMWKRIDKKMKLSSDDAYKNVGKFLNKKRIKIYRKLSKLLKSTGMPVEIIMALDLAETDLRDRARSGPGARGPMQVMPGTVRSINRQLAKWKSQGDKKGKYRKEYLTAVKLIGSHKIDWKRVNEPEYGRRVGITVAYLSYAKLARIFKTRGLVYNPKISRWQFVLTSSKVNPYIYLSTAVLNAAYNGRGEGMVLKMIKKYGPIPLKVFEIRKLSPEDQAKRYFDPHQKIGWLEGNGRGEYSDETRTHFLRLWRYYNAIQRYKSDRPGIWTRIVPNKKYAFNQIGAQLGAAFTSVGAFSAIKTEQKIGGRQLLSVDQAI